MGRKGAHQRVLEDATRETGLSVGERIRKTCEELGPTFIKFGQILSTRTDIITEDVAQELSKLQDAVPPFPYEQAKALVEEELRAKIEDVFESFCEEPIASASMSQVYTARLRSGMQVAVKVQRPDIHSIVDIDVHILKRIASFIDKYTKYGEMYDFPGMVEEFARVLEDELDFTIEAENNDRFRENRAEDPKVTAPRIKWVYTTSKVLTMELIEGIKITDVPCLKENNISPAALARTFVGSLITQMLADGFFHADPHPGNLMVRKDGQIVFIDLGMMGELSEKYKRLLTDMLIGLSLKNNRRVAQALVDLGVTQTRVESKAFEDSVGELLDEFLYVPLREVSVMRVFMGLFDLAARYKIKIPRTFSMIAKCLGTAQNIVEQLDPGLNMLEIAQQTAKSLVVRSIGGEDIRNALISGFMDTADIAKSLPGILARFLKKAEETDFVFELKIKEMEKIEKRMEHVFNRMSFGIILLSISIVLSGIIIAIGAFGNSADGGALYSISTVALVAGLVAAGTIVVGMILSILLSGRRK